MKILKAIQRFIRDNHIQLNVVETPQPSDDKFPTLLYRDRKGELTDDPDNANRVFVWKIVNGKRRVVDTIIEPPVAFGFLPANEAMVRDIHA